MKKAFAKFIGVKESEVHESDIPVVALAGRYDVLAGACLLSAPTNSPHANSCGSTFLFIAVADIEQWFRH